MLKQKPFYLRRNYYTEDKIRMLGFSPHEMKEINKVLLGSIDATTIL